MSLHLARPDLLHFVTYSSARKESAPSAVMLNANELPWAPYAGGDGLNRYPDPQPSALLARLAQIYGVTPEQLLVGRGSDEAIDLLIRGFCRARQDAIVISPPTFGMYRVCAQLQGAEVVEVPLQACDGFALRPQALIDAALARSAKLVFICSPNNPTGQLASREAILAVADALDERALVIVDEAYVEFADQPSLSEAMPGRSNLLVLRTLSKAFGLAGARIGSLIGSPAIIAFLRGLMAPYPLSAPSVAAALEALSDTRTEAFSGHLAQIKAERKELAERLQAHPEVIRVWPSDANFLCVQWRDACAVAAHLAARGIIVRDLSRYPGLSQCLRLSIGTSAENAAVLAALAAEECA